MDGSWNIDELLKISDRRLFIRSVRTDDFRPPRSNTALLFVACLMLLTFIGPANYAQTPFPETHATVGFQQTLFQIVVPGSELRAKPINDRDQPVIVRIIDTYSHGTDFRYDLEFRGLDSGEFNLADYLQRIDVSDHRPIPAIPIVIHSLLPPGQVEPRPLVAQPVEYRSYYLPLVIVGSTLWSIGFLLILFYGRFTTKRPQRELQPITVADRLQPLIDAAVAGHITTEQQAELERVLSTFWSQKMRWEHLSAVQVREKLRAHPEAGQLLDQLDLWLHRPKNGPATPPIDVAKLLEPYR